MPGESDEPERSTDKALDHALLRGVARWLPFAMAGHLLVGVPALLISLVVAYGTFVQAGATQRMQEAATWPLVAYRTGNYTSDGQRLMNLSLTNNGLGPALIGPVEVSYRGRAMRSPVDLLESCCGYRKGQAMQLRTLPIVNSALRPGEEVLFMGFPDVAANVGVIDRLDATRDELRVRACYCSIFDDCWTIEGAQTRPRPVTTCPTNWTVFQQR